MKTFAIKVTEYGIKKGEKVFPSHYTWDYCIQKRVPYIIIRPKIRYSNILFKLSFKHDYGIYSKLKFEINRQPYLSITDEFQK